MANALAGKRILVVEDEYFIASDLKRALTAQGAHVVGPAGTLAQGLALVREAAIDAAVLDVNLDGANSYPIADELAGRGTPYLFLTGYDDWALPEAYRAVLHIAKPHPVERVLETVERLLVKDQSG